MTSLRPTAEVFVPGQRWGVEVEEPHFVSLLREVLYTLIQNPATFNDHMFTVTDALNDSITTASQLNAVGNVIFEHSVLEPNFTYTGAKMCCYMCENLKLPKDIPSFRHVINERLKHVCINKDVLIAQPETVNRVHGTCFFLAELFINVEVEKDGKMQKVNVYRTGLQELIEALAKHPTNENIKCLGKLFKLIGAVIEDYDKEKKGHTEDVGNIFHSMKPHILNDQMDKNVRKMWLDLVELRAGNWGRKSLSQSDSSENAHNPSGDAPQAEFSNEGVFYDAEGNVIQSPQEAGLEEDFEDDYDDFIAADDPSLAHEFGQLEMNSAAEGYANSEQYLPANENSAEVDRALEDFIRDSANRGMGYSSRQWSANS